MKHKLFVIAAFITGFLIVLTVRAVTFRLAAVNTNPPNRPFEEPQAPSHSIAGVTLTATGSAKIMKRTGKDWEEAKVNDSVLQGESFQTGEDGKLTVDFQNILSLSLSSNTELSFVSAIPSSFLVNQTAGETEMTVSENSQGISVRIPSGLVDIKEGKVSVSVDPYKRVSTLVLSSGSGKFGYVDLDNQTHVLEIPPQETLIFSESRRTVRVY